MSSPARELHRKLESSVITSPLGHKIGQMNTRGLQNMYADLNKRCDNAKTSLLSDFNQLSKHHNVCEEKMKELHQNCLAHISDFTEKLDREMKVAMANSATEIGDARPSQKGAASGELKLSGEENPSYVSPSHNLQFRGPMG